MTHAGKHHPGEQFERVPAQGVSTNGGLRLDAFCGAGFGPVDLDLPRGAALGLLHDAPAAATALNGALAGRIRTISGTARLEATALGDGDPNPQSVGLARNGDAFIDHLDVAGNIALPLRLLGWSRGAIDARTAELLAWLGLDALAHAPTSRLPAESASRVRIARALAPRPHLLLAENPGAGLAPGAREALLAHLRRLIQARGITTILTTDDPGEAIGFGGTAALLAADRTGRPRLLQHGSPTELLDAPRHAAVARAFGAANLIAGQVTGQADDITEVRLADGSTLEATPPHGIDTAALSPGTACEIAIRPDRLAVAFVNRAPQVAEPGSVPATLLDVQHRGDWLRLRFRLADGTEFIAHRPPHAVRGTLERDRPALLACQPQHATVFPLE